MDNVCVIVAARNESQKIAQCVRSILAVIRDQDEVVVVDDGSDDGTGDIVRGLKDPRLHLLTNAAPTGRAAARNRAIASTTATYVAIQDADDVALAGRLRPLRLLESDDTVVAAGGQCITMTSQGRAWLHQSFPTSDEAIREGLKAGVMTLCHTSSVIRRSALLLAGGYDPTFTRSQDLDLFKRLALLGAMANDPGPTVLYRHPVLLSWSYWIETRRNRLLIEGRRESFARELGTYPLSMARRTLTYVRTHRVARVLLANQCPAS